MCDEHTVEENERFLAGSGALSRRRFTTLTAGAAMATLLPRPANAADVVEQDVTVTTPDGEADCYFVHPAAGKHAGVIVWPDILGLRPAFRLMGRRLAESGYAVLVVNPYYRSAKAPVVEEGASFQDAATREQVLPLARSLTPETNVTDARAFVAFLDQQPAVDTDRQIGTTGYCMGGPMTMRTAAAATYGTGVRSRSPTGSARSIEDGDSSEGSGNAIRRTGSARGHRFTAAGSSRTRPTAPTCWCRPCRRASCLRSRTTTMSGSRMRSTRCAGPSTRQG